MSWATATCTCERCGRIFHQRKECYNSREAASWEEWASENFKVCGECKEKDAAQKREEQTVRAREIAEASDYPVLKGSEKQIAWALRIREEKADALEDLREKVIRTVEKRPERSEEGKEMLYAIERIMAHDYAGWWIDTRSASVDQMIKETLKAMRKETK